MSSLNDLVKRRQFVLFCALMAVISTIAGAGWYLSSGKNEKTAAVSQPQEPLPDMTGVVNRAFDEKLSRSAVTQSQLMSSELRREMQVLRQEMQTLSRAREEDSKRIEELEQENRLLQEQADSSVPPTPQIPVPAMPSSHAHDFYSGAGVALPAQLAVTRSPYALDTTRFSYGGLTEEFKFPYIPSGSFARAIVIEGADTNAAVTGPQNTAPMQVRLTGKVQLPNDGEMDLTGCFVNLEAYGDVSSERAEVRTRTLSCRIAGEVIDQKIAGHVSFMGKNGIKGEVVMRNGKILGWAFGAGFVDGIGRGIEKSASPQPGIGAVASLSAADIGRAGAGGGASQAAKTLSDYYIKRAEQYHPVIPIGAGNEVTVVFQEGFQPETLTEIRRRKAAQSAQAPAVPAAVPDTPGMLNQLQDLRVGDFVRPAEIRQEQ